MALSSIHRMQVTHPAQFKLFMRLLDSFVLLSHVSDTISCTILTKKPVQAYVPSDLDLFYSNFATEIPAGTRPTVDLIDGAIIQNFETGSQYNLESNLDLQYAISLGILEIDLFPTALQYTDMFYDSLSPEGYCLPGRRYSGKRFFQQLPGCH